VKPHIRHAGLDPASSPPPSGRVTSWTPDRLRGDGSAR